MLPSLPPDLVAVAARSRGLFRSADARDAGLDSRELQRLVAAGRLRRLRRGLYLDGAGVTPEDPGLADAAAVLLRCGPDAVLSHGTAARLHGLDLLAPRLARALGDRDGPAEEPPRLQVTCPPRSAVRTLRGVGVHRAGVPPEHVTVVSGLPVTTVARTVLDLARSRDFRTALVAADSALRFGVPRRELDEVLAACDGWPGTRGARRVLAATDPGSGSAGETLLRCVFVEQGLPPWRSQVPVRDEAGLAGVVDFLFPGQRTVSEFDGRGKYAVPAGVTGERATAVLVREKEREDRIRATGLEVVRTVWRDLSDPSRIAARHRQAFGRAARR